MDTAEAKTPLQVPTAGTPPLSSHIQSLQPAESAHAAADAREAPEDPGVSGKRIVQVEEYPGDLRLAIEEQEKTKQKALVVRMRKCHNNDGKLLELDSIVVQSESLEETLSDVFDGYQGITPSLKKLVFKAPFRPFYYRWTRLESILQRQKVEDTEAAKYTQLLRDVLHAELRDTMAEIEDLVSHRVMTWPLLWALFEPGIPIVATQEGQPDRFFIGDRSEYTCQFGRSDFNIAVKFVDWDGHCFGYQQRPKVRAALRTTLVAYSGTATFQVKGRPVKRQLGGRIVVDADSYFNNNSSERPHLAFLVDGAIAPRMEIEDQSHVEQESRVDKNSMRPRRGGNVSYPKPEWPYGNQILTADNEPKPVSKLTDEQLVLCNTRVCGYSVKAKLWGVFDVDGVSDIVWNDNAFPNLILPSGYKDLVLSIVEGKAASKDDTFDDFIEGKGLGMILLLLGNPGIGKTLTAEAIADKVRKPLYTLSAGELGQSASHVEAFLGRALELAEKWDAIMLFDECDVFLQERSMAHLSHNEIVAVFLRLLEYYRGIMFMTMNRAESTDRAFQSRIHLTLHYPDLEPEAKNQIWRHFVGQAAQDISITDEECARQAQLPLNGREIKNTVKTALLLAR